MLARGIRTPAPDAVDVRNAGLQGLPDALFDELHVLADLVGNAEVDGLADLVATAPECVGLPDHSNAPQIFLWGQLQERLLAVQSHVGHCHRFHRCGCRDIPRGGASGLKE